MTLIELLVVIIILTTLVAAAIPLLAPSNDQRRVREAGRGANAFISGAPAMAISHRRPVGIAFPRLSQKTGRDYDRTMCVEMYYVEQPPPYSGFDDNSRACVALHSAMPGYVLVRFVTRGTTGAGMPAGWMADLFPDGTIRPGDVIEIGGTRYELRREQLPNIGLDDVDYFQSVGGVPEILARPLNDSGQLINPKYDNAGREIGGAVARIVALLGRARVYKILRLPMPTADEPYQMPEGTAIDLRASSLGNEADIPGGYFYVQGECDNDDPIVIMFSPEGRVARLSYSQSPNNSVPFDGPVVDNIYLLVGRVDKSPPDVGSDLTLQTSAVSAAVTEDQRARLREPLNWLADSSNWIVIGSQSGRVATVQNAYANLPTITTMSLSDEEKRNQQILAARENTRNTGRLGGR